MVGGREIGGLAPCPAPTEAVETVEAVEAAEAVGAVGGGGHMCSQAAAPMEAVEAAPPEASAICWSMSSAPDQVWCLSRGTPVRRSWMGRSVCVRVWWGGGFCARGVN